LATFQARGLDAGVQERLVIWKVSARIFMDYPLLGIGFSNMAFSSIEKEYYQTFHLKRRLPFKFSGPPHPHNIFLQVAVYLGLTGLFFFALLLVRTWKDIDHQG